SAATINNVLHNCADEGVVLLQPGTFNLTSAINFSATAGGAAKDNVTLRGAGADQTQIVFANGVTGNCTGIGGTVCMGSTSNYLQNPSCVTNWTAGYSQGATAITLTNISPGGCMTPLQVGQLLVIDQEMDMTQAPTVPPGGIFVS